MSDPPTTPLDRVVIATRNPGKVGELRALLAPAGVEVVGIDEVAPEAPEPDETGETFEANATIKAAAYARACGLPCLADDSGLEVDALGGAPGVISSHYAWDGRTEGEPAALTRAERDAANTRRLLAELEGVAEERRTARFVCVMALCLPPGGAGLQPALLSSHKTFDGAFKQHRRRLPHWQVGGATYFVTWRLAEGDLEPDERQIVVDALLHWHDSRFILHSATVMPDHVHLLLRPLSDDSGRWPELPDIVRGLKRHTSRQIQERRGTHGSLWQREYYDRIMREGQEAEEKRRYIEQNAVRWGLCEQPGDYPYLVRDPGRLQTGPTQIIARGTFEGRIGTAPGVPRGEGGFGYDPVFLVGPDFARTSAELTADEKNARSHRGAAARAMLAELRRLPLG